MLRCSRHHSRREMEEQQLLGGRAGGGNWEATDALLPATRAAAAATAAAAMRGPDVCTCIAQRPTRATQLWKSGMRKACQQSHGTHAGLHRGAGMVRQSNTARHNGTDIGAPLTWNAVSSNTTRVPRAVLEPGTRRMPPWRIIMPNCGHRDDPGMSRLHLQGVCRSEIGRPALHAVHPLRLAQKLQIHRVECQNTAAEARG